MVHTPHPVQQIALSLNNSELLFGGSAGGGKSDWMLMCALQYVDVPGYSALILRRTWPDLNSPGAILERFKSWMAAFPEVHKGDSGRLWTFPSGAKLQFSYAARPDDKFKFQGAEYQFIGFDEATQFEPEIYKYLSSRLRRPAIPCMICTRELVPYKTAAGNKAYRHKENNTNCNAPLANPVALQQYGPAPDGTTIFDLPLRLRATANPGGLSHQFFKDRFIDQIEINDVTKEPIDAVFIPSALKDNPSLNRAEYEKRLEGLSLVDRERLLNGDWEIMDSGALFERGWFESVASAPDPKDVRTKVRFWDMAASDGKKADYTVGALVSVTHDGKWCIEDIKRVQYLPPAVERLMRQTAMEDGLNVRIFAEQEPGGSGKTLISHIKRNILTGYQFEGIRSTGSKEARAGALVSQASAHNVSMVRADWNVAFLDEAVAFGGNPQHDDQIDAVAGALNAISFKKRPVRILV